MQKNLERQMAQLRKTAKRVQTGFKTLDDLTGGLVKGGLTAVAGRPGWL